MRFISGVLATFVACASLAKADCEPIDVSLPCDEIPYYGVADGNYACNVQCRMQGDASGHCEPRDGCPGLNICVCSSTQKRDEGPVEDDVEVEVQEFIRGKTTDFSSQAQAGIEESLRKLTEDLHGDGEAEADAKEFIGAMKKYIDGGSDPIAEEFVRALANEDNDVPENVEARDTLEKRTISCGLPVGSDWACEARCWALGKTGGSCNSINNVCICYTN